MKMPRGPQSICALVVVLTLGLGAASAHADPLTIPGYTVTDLGPGTPAFSTDGNGNGVLNAPNGQSYAFPQSPDTILNLNPGSWTTTPIPLLPSPSGTGFPFPNNVWNYATNELMNSNGIVAAIDVSGVGDHYSIDQAFYVQHNADGTWGQPVSFYTGSSQGAAGSLIFDTFITGLSKTNNILFNTQSTSSGWGTQVYNINTGTITNLGSSLLNLDYHDPQGIAIDDDGRILLNAGHFDTLNGGHETNLLLTPDGLSPAPLEVPAPEPGTLGVMLLAIAGFVVHRVRERRQLGRAGHRAG